MSANPWWDHLLSMATLAGCGESNQICMVHCSTPHGRYLMFCLHSTSTFAKVSLFWRRWRVLLELQGDLRASLLQVYQPQYLVHGFPGFCISELDATFLCNKVDGSWVDRYVTLFYFLIGNAEDVRNIYFFYFVMPPRLPIATSISVNHCLVINVTPSKIINETIQEITTRILEAKKIYV